MGFFGDIWEGVKSIAEPVIKPAINLATNYLPGGEYISSALSFLNPTENYQYGNTYEAIMDGFSSMAGNLPSSALDFLNKQYTANQANAVSQENTALAWQRSMDAYKTRYQNTMADMRAAGLNPILAASGGFNVGSAPTASTAQSFMQAPTEIPRATSSALETSQAAKAQEEVKEIGWKIKTMAQGINESVARIDKIFAETENVKQDEKKKWEECKKIIKQIEEMEANILLMSAKKMQSWTEADRIEADKEYIRKQTAAVSEQLKMLQATNKYYEGDFGKLLGLLNAITNSGNISIRR